MKKSQEKKDDLYNLDFRWSDLKSGPVIPIRTPRNVEEYLDFLEEVALENGDTTPVKIYKERFLL